MKVLLINKFYYLSGGAERYVFEWEKLLRAHGHQVLVFSMRDPRNRPCAQERFFADPVRFDTALPAGDKLRAAAHSVWSRDAGRRLEALLRAEGTPDIAHLHSFMYQLTPAVLRPLIERGVPLVQTCHEYFHICVNQHLYNHRIDRICEACLRHGRLAPLWTRCIKGSLAASAAGCAAGLADAFLGRTRDHIQRFFAVGEFMRGKLIEGGLPPRRVVRMPNFVDAQSIAPGDGPGDYILFLGRLVPQKGIGTFLRAAGLSAGIPCKIAGGGALEPDVRRRIAQDGLTHVEALGHLESDVLCEIVRRARAVVVPSEWYEPFPLAILEAMAARRPVIATAIAGPAEMVSHREDGLLFEPGDAAGLAGAMQELWQDPSAAMEMGRRGREKVVNWYNPRDHYERLIGHFREVVA